MKRVAVIGGGASGLTAAYFASEKCSVTLFEKQKKIARKILITGNGRCNISNTHIDSSRYHGHNPDFVNNVFSRFSSDDTVSFFNSLGIPFVEEKDGKLFPASLQASLLPKIFEYELVRRNVDMKLHRRVDQIKPINKAFELTTAGKESLEFDSVILACGSCAYPQVGASRAGYELARSLGHHVYEPFPAILPVNIPRKALHRLQGTKWDCSLKVMVNNKVVAQSEDEVLFTGYGISGPGSLKISRWVNELVLAGQEPDISIDFFPEKTEAELRELLDLLWQHGSRKLSFSLLGILKERMPEVLLEIAGIDYERRVNDLSEKEKRKIVSSLKDTRIFPGEPRGFDDAVAAAGGVDVVEINPSNMESLKQKNIFITGELLDIDGDSGGFNLQFAWSTGAVAGKAQC